MASCPITSSQIEGKNVEAIIDYFLRLQNLWMLTAAMKLKDASSLGGNL